MIMLKVKFESALTEQEVYRVAEERLPLFRDVPGLVQKYYLKCAEPNHYSGVYIWDSAESMKNYRTSELAASIPAAYQIKGQPQMVLGDVFTQLRNQGRETNTITIATNNMPSQLMRNDRPLIASEDQFIGSGVESVGNLVWEQVK